ncbi:hypothetical protein [Bradyrhizobium sp. SYSU BS000235]|uniref:COG3904 family protein n=1 Tax=Bradyrhizobium sp. SYSU BS000235 TaxID=3411332 RepID=UPI003C77EA67
MNRDSRFEADAPLRPWGQPPAEQSPQEPREVPPNAPGRRSLFNRSSLVSLLFAIAIIGLYGGRAYQDLSAPQAWAYWKDLYFSHSLTTSVVTIDALGPSNRALAVKGEIGAASASVFRTELDEAKLVAGDTVILSSPGGRVDQALIMGEIIRSRGLRTLVGSVSSDGRLKPAYCASACVLTYAGGTARALVPGSRLGVHQFTAEVSKEDARNWDGVAYAQKTSGMILEYMTRMGVSPSILQQMSASKDIRWLSEKDAADLNLVTKRLGSG